MSSTLLYVQCNSSWSQFNLTLFCLKGTTISQWQYLNVQRNPILNAGTYNFGNIKNFSFAISQHPINCHFKLTKYGNNDDALSGEIFWVASHAASSTTFQPERYDGSSSGGCTRKTRLEWETMLARKRNSPGPSSETGYAKRYAQGSFQPYEHETKNPNQPELMGSSLAELGSSHYGQPYRSELPSCGYFAEFITSRFR